MNLCARVNFQLTKVIKNGVARLTLVSAHKTRVNLDGECGRICADVRVHPHRGRIGGSMLSERRTSYGGFSVVSGRLVIAIRGVLLGQLVNFSSSTSCTPLSFDSSVAKRVIACDVMPPVDPRCTSPDNPTWNCISCVDTGEFPQVVCSIEQKTSTMPCSALGQPAKSVAAQLSSDKALAAAFAQGALITPKPGMTDIFGDEAPFRAPLVQGGLWKYFLRKRFDALIDVLDLTNQNCDDCPNWLCCYVTHYLTPPFSWMVHCTDIYKEAPDISDEPGACCRRISATTYECTESTRAVCVSEGGSWKGPGTSCSCINCVPSAEFRSACCLFGGFCAMLTPDECQCVGGTFFAGSDCSSFSCPIQDSPNLNPRDVQLFLGDSVGYLAARFDDITRACFEVSDPQCFSTGPDTTNCHGPCWFHLQDNEPKGRMLDSITVDIDVGYSTDATVYPQYEPGWVEMANAAFKKVRDLIMSLTIRDRQHSYDGPEINLWREVLSFPCASAPVVWPDLEVIPRHSGCSYGADLVMTTIAVQLRMSAEQGSVQVQAAPPLYVSASRMSATMYVTLGLAVRLHSGWRDVPCDVPLANSVGEPCGPYLSDPSKHLIVTGNGASRVPTFLTWQGLNGPLPWGIGDFTFTNRAKFGSACCEPLCAINGLEVMGAVNDTLDPFGPQRYTGSVVLMVSEGDDLENTCDCN